MIIQPYPRPRTRLAVDEFHPLFPKVLQAGDFQGVPRGKDQPQAALRQGEQGDSLAWQKAADKGDVVGCGFVIPKMAACKIGFAFLQRDQPPQAAAEKRLILTSGCNTSNRVVIRATARS